MMGGSRTLSGILSEPVRRFPDRTAVEDPTGASLSYRELDRVSEGIHHALAEAGIVPGDRVGLCVPKSAAVVAGMCGILRAGAAYVPVDSSAPAARSGTIFRDCDVRAVLIDEPRLEHLRPELELEPLGALAGAPPLVLAVPRGERGAPRRDPSLAYLLYTSGSTGRPKGVMLTHENALSFLDWCSETFEPDEHDRFSSHAPFHFDLSILDVFLSLRHGATLVLIPDDLARQPGHLAPFVAEQRLTVWYSTPSVLSLMLEGGGLAGRDYSPLRLVLFAGEVFPLKHLRVLREVWPVPRMFNLYGPTETNVCTFHEIPARIPSDRSEPFPIGRACSHVRTRICDERGATVEPGGEGELCVAGRGVMAGYWNLAEANARAFFEDDAGERWYRTGDVVVEDADGGYAFLGRRDRMVKRRGYRVELGEIEAALYRHPMVKEVAVVSRPDATAGLVIQAFLVTTTGERLSTIALKRYCAEQVPVYMVPDRFEHLDSLPRTSTDKIDYQGLATLA